MRYYPNVFGYKCESKLNSFFRLQKEYPIGNPLRYPIGRFPFRVDISFGSRKTGRKQAALRINESVAIHNSSDKIRTKRIWEANNIPCAKGTIPFDTLFIGNAFHMTKLREQVTEKFGRQELYPFVIKQKKGHSGEGFKLIRDEETLFEYLYNLVPEKKSNLFIEDYFEKTTEFRIHVAPALQGVSCTYKIDRPVQTGVNQWSITTEHQTFNDGVFMFSKKKRKNGADTVCMSLGENVFFSTRFEEPEQSPQMKAAAVQAIKLLGLDFGFVDCMYNANTGEFMFSESGCNPGMSVHESTGTCLTAQVYRQMLKYLITQKGIEKGLTAAPRTPNT